MKMQSHDRLCFFWSHHKRLYREILHWFFSHLVLCSKKKKNGIKAANIFSPRTICILPIWYGWNLSSTHPKPHHSPRPFTLKQKTKKTVTWLHLFCDTHTKKSKASFISSQMIQSIRTQFRWQTERRYSDEHEYSTSTSTEGSPFTCSRHEPFFSECSHTQRYIGHQETQSH